MRRFTFAITSIFLVSLSLNIFISSTQAYYTNMPASVVIGQPDFESNTSGTTSSTLSGVADVFVDSHGRLIVTELNNNRVLVWNSVPTINGTSADLVVGQDNFTSGSANRGGAISANTLSGPSGVYSTGDMLFVSDSGNRRTLIWNTFPTQNGQAADVVVGQTNFNSASDVCSASGADRPYDVKVYDNKLLISDRDQDRILIWNEIPTTNGSPADIVVGKNDLSTCTASSTSQSTITQPRNISIDNYGKLFVVDSNSSRILIWNTIPVQNGQPADIVVGQPNFTSYTQGLYSASTFGSTTMRGVYSSGTRLFVPDNTRLLIFNTIPTSNGISADLVLGQINFTNSTANGGDSVSSRGCSGCGRVFEYRHKLIVSENNRILIFEDISSTPGLTLNSPENISEEKVKISGTVIQGEYGKYALQHLQASVNAGGFDPVTHLDGGRQQGDSDTIYEFYHEFEPWANFKPRDQWTQGLGYTIKIKAISYNAEDDYAFHFSPFTLESVNQEESTPHFNFIVPFDHIQIIKNNINNFEVYLDNQKYLTNISPENINTETGRVYISVNTNNITSQPINLPAGDHEVKIKALDNWGHSFDSNTLTVEFSSPIYSSGGSLTNSSWFPLQINKISGVNSGILRSFDLTSVKPSYKTTNLNPTISGIAFAGAEVTLTVVNSANSEETKTFSTTVSPDSTFSLNPTLYPNSLLTISVRDVLGNFTQLPTINLTQ